MRSNRNKYLLWGLIFAISSALMVVQVGFWNHLNGVNIEDVNIYKSWSDFIVKNHALPTEETWQYPPAAAFLMLIPRIGGGDFGKSFVVMMVVFYLIGLVLLAIQAKRTKRDAGVWVWLLAMPLLSHFPVLRFDLVPTVIAIAALVIIHRRPGWFGVLVGLGAMIKVWPIVLLFGEWKRRRLLVAAAAAAAVIVLIFVVSAILFGKQTTFISNQDARGLQVEAVAATPWQVRQMVTGELTSLTGGSGTLQIETPPAEALSSVLTVLSLIILALAAIWWFARDRAIAGGRRELTSDAVGRDFIFTVVVALVVVSRVLSPQYLIWLVGLSAVVLSDRETRIARPAWVVIGAVVLTAGIYQAPSNYLIRNGALVVAALDAAWIMVAAVRPRGSGGRDEAPPELARPPEHRV